MTVSAWYNDTVPTELADRARLSDPLTIASKVANHHLHPMTRAEPERFDALEQVGFKVERYGDSLYNLNEKGGSHYMDTGGSAMVSKRLVRFTSNLSSLSYGSSNSAFRSKSNPTPQSVTLIKTDLSSTTAQSLRQTSLYLPRDSWAQFVARYLSCSGRTSQTEWKSSGV